MQDQEETGGPLWTCGEMILKVQRAARVSDRIMHIRAPGAFSGWARIGATELASVCRLTILRTYFGRRHHHPMPLNGRHGTDIPDILSALAAEEFACSPSGCYRSSGHTSLLPEGP